MHKRKIFKGGISFGARSNTQPSDGRALASISYDVLDELGISTGTRFAYRLQKGEGTDYWCIITPGVEKRGKGTGRVLETRGQRATLEMQGWHLQPFKRADRDLELLVNGDLRFILPPGLHDLRTGQRVTPEPVDGLKKRMSRRSPFKAKPVIIDRVGGLLPGGLAFRDHKTGRVVLPNARRAISAIFGMLGDAELKQILEWIADGKHSVWE